MRVSIGFVRKGLVTVAMAAVIVCLALVSVGGVMPVSADKKPIYRGNSDNSVSLMVNVYWGSEFIPEMLEIFAKNGIKTTFFVGGTWVRDNEQLFKTIVSHGHEIGNHGYFHKSHDKLNADRNREEMQATHSLVENVCGVDMKLFAPPSGAFSAITLDVAEEMGYTTVMWSKDTIDWRDQDVKIIRKRAVKNIQGGDLVLMHPTAATVGALPGIIADVKSASLSVKTVSEVIGLQN